jgi:hypothetical protein
MDPKYIYTACISLVVGLLGKMIYDLIINKKTDVQRAKDGFLNLEDMEKNCESKQHKCTELISAEFKSGFEKIETKLMHRMDFQDIKFDNYDKKLELILVEIKGDIPSDLKSADGETQYQTINIIDFLKKNKGGKLWMVTK